MDNSKKLSLVKILHTAIWCVFVVAILFVLYAGVFDKVNTLVWYCIGLIIIEGMVLFACKWRCPLTILGSRYTSDTQVGFDICIPKRLAKHNKTIFSTLFIIGVILVLWRIL